MTAHALFAAGVARARERSHELDRECDPFADTLPDGVMRGGAEGWPVRGVEGTSTEVALPRERAIRAVLATTPVEPRGHARPSSRPPEFDLTDVDVNDGDREDRGSPHETHAHEAYAMIAT
jgi:hypothetical protein